MGRRREQRGKGDRWRQPGTIMGIRNEFSQCGRRRIEMFCDRNIRALKEGAYLGHWLEGICIANESEDSQSVRTAGKLPCDRRGGGRHPEKKQP